ncbi:hypothetical protein B296_00038326 [Ensete ventricosum]|uniref:Uncharacterized protein n=1 Tax=Ensete ventricosum TaxID=4639 RepID=A0A426ZQU9_ENSVE|nr:hypothetical protein B296_00038326 [Ensete ventricosum]
MSLGCLASSSSLTASSSSTRTPHRPMASIGLGLCGYPSPQAKALLCSRRGSRWGRKRQVLARGSVGQQPLTASGRPTSESRNPFPGASSSHPYLT